MTEILNYGAPILRHVATEVGEINPALVTTVSDMMNTMYTRHAYGVAAPQVGLDRRLFVFDQYTVDDVTGNRKMHPQVVVNPVITPDLSTTALMKEGCLSLPGLWFDVERPASCFLTGVDMNGNTVEFEAEGLLARMFMHEMDHLNGVLVVDYATRQERREAMRAFDVKSDLRPLINATTALGQKRIL